MACSAPAGDPREIQTPVWHSEAKTPIVDGKYYDPKTGELCTLAEGVLVCGGPPDVDVVVMNLHAATVNCVCRAPRSFPVELLLAQMMQVIEKRKIEIESLNATKYAIRIILAHEMTVDEFQEITREMINVPWNEETES